jgi:G:T/U-mismatch repair DNA glycosylase
VPDYPPPCNPDARPEAVITATLCLMSCYVQHPAALYANKVVANLARMADLASLSPEMRTICARLADRWEAIRREALARAESGAPALDRRALH